MEHIAEQAFSFCTSLGEPNFPDSINYIGGGAFDGAPWIEYSADDFVIAGDGMLFDYKGGDTVVEVPEGVKFIAGDAFSYNKTITDVKLPKSLEKIQSSAFYDCTALVSIEIPDTVSYISSKAFYNVPWYENHTDDFVIAGDGVLIKYNGTAEDVTIPGSVKVIAEEVFWNCREITKLTIPDNVTYIGEYAFFECTGIEEVTLPNSINFIGQGAFQECYNLKKVKLPETLTEISGYTFSGCNLEQIEIPQEVVSIGKRAFVDCNMTQLKIPNRVTSIDDHAFEGCRVLAEVVFPISLNEIGSGAFQNCYDLESVKLPSNVMVDGDAFDHNTTLYVKADSYTRQYMDWSNLYYYIYDDNTNDNVGEVTLNNSSIAFNVCDKTLTEDQQSILVVSSYTGDKMTETNITSISLSANGTGAKVEMSNLFYTDYVKIFAWDNMDSMNDLIQVRTVKIN